MTYGWSDKGQMVHTIADGTCTDALTPKLLLAWDAQLLGSCPGCYDDAVCLHLTDTNGKCVMLFVNIGMQRRCAD